jgi:hypothetical protein
VATYKFPLTRSEMSLTKSPSNVYNLSKLNIKI